MLKKKLKIVGTLGRIGRFGPRHIRNAIQQGSKALAHNSEFTGRPETGIYASEQEVVKIRRDLKLTAAQAAPWLAKVLEKERRLGIYHPDKTWFYIYVERDGVADPAQEVLIGSITPRLRPLHKVLELHPETEQERARTQAYISAMFGLYLNTAKSFEVKLDEGLSNFALDADDRLYYVDDETYPWDKFISFSVMLGVLVRKLDWLERDFARGLALELGQQLDHIFVDLNYRASIAYQLRSAFMPAGKKRDIANLICATLNETAPAVGTSAGMPEARTPLETGSAGGFKDVLLPTASAAVVAVDERTDFDQPQVQAVAERLHVKPAVFSAARPLAILADIHANLPALDVVLDWLDQAQINQALVLGDLVGYGPDALEVIERMQASGFQIIKGNHDHSVALGAYERGLSKHARQVAEWTHQRLSAEQRNWLKQLPPVIDNEHWVAVHGAPLDPEFFYGYVYEMTFRENLDKLVQLGRRLCFHGHSHMPGLYGRDQSGQDRHRVGETLSLQEFTQCLVCPGSIGQPRNGVPHAQFAIYDPERDEVAFKALPYDYEPTVERMKAEGFPAELYRRLSRGV